MIRNFDKFVKESVENKGKGVGGDTDLFPSAPKKQTINRSIPTMDFLRIGKHIQTKKIDGFIDSVQNESIYISDRITGEIKKYTLKEVIKELTRAKEESISSTVQGFEGTPAWAKHKKVNEEWDSDMRRSMPGPDTMTATEDDFEIGSEEMDVTDELDDNQDIYHEESKGFGTMSKPLTNRLKYGTEDNPEGIPNIGNRRSMANESWSNYWEKFNENQMYISENVEEEEEDEVKIVRGTEDNPLPDKKRTKIENYE